MNIHSTTILCISRNGQTVMAGDGQVTVGSSIVKLRAKKVRRLYENKILAGFAGGAADAFALFSRFETKLMEFSGNLERASVELVKDWRMDKALRRLEAFLIVADTETQLILSGSGDLISSDDGILSIGSGSPYALAASRALIRNTGLSAKEIAENAMSIVSEICIYTNNQLTIEVLP